MVGILETGCRREEGRRREKKNWHSRETPNTRAGIGDIGITGGGSTVAQRRGAVNPYSRFVEAVHEDNSTIYSQTAYATNSTEAVAAEGHG